MPQLFDITVDTGGLEDDLRALGEECERILSVAAVRGTKEAVEGGAAYARANHTWKNVSGALEGSIVGRMDVVTSNGAAGTIEATANHASFLEKGTPPHVIRPKAGEGFVGPLRRGQSRRTSEDIGTHRVALRWVSDGRTHFAAVVHHPGTEAQPFIGPAGYAAGLILTDVIDNAMSAVAALIEG